MFYTSSKDLHFQKLLTKDNSLASQQPFVLGTYTAGPALSMNAMTGYKMDYTQVLKGDFSNFNCWNYHIWPRYHEKIEVNQQGGSKKEEN